MGSYEHATTTDPETPQQTIDRLKSEMSPEALKAVDHLDDEIIGIVSDIGSKVSPYEIPQILKYLVALYQPEELKELEEAIRKANAELEVEEI
jgi:hypothetical protein